MTTNPEQVAELLPVIKAFSERKPVQFKHLKCDNPWQDLTDPDQFSLIFNQFYEWRVKPEPKEFWLVSQKGSTIPYGVWSKEPEHLRETHDIIHVREVGE